MKDSEKLIQRLAFYGRLVDEITREIIPYQHFKVSMHGSSSMPIYKGDGYFVFSDLEPSITDYQFRLSAQGYRARMIKKNLPAASPVELTYPGEDELYVIIKNVENSTDKKVIFDSIPFVKTIPKGSMVIGEGGFSTTLTETLEGENITFAVLQDITPLSSLTPGKILRFVRSHNILMYPGPYYPFAPGTTIAALKFVNSNSPDMPAANVRCEITKVNMAAISPNNVASLDIKTVSLTNPAVELVLGTENDIVTYSNERGDAVFYYSADTPIEKLTLEITADEYNPVTQDITLVKKQRNFNSIQLTKI
jgi:hypothetical protein